MIRSCEAGLLRAVRHQQAGGSSGTCTVMHLRIGPPGPATQTRRPGSGLTSKFICVFPEAREMRALGLGGAPEATSLADSEV